MSLVAGELTQLAPLVWRLVAPNAGLMTGPGTNSYFVGDNQGVCLIDPGPDDSRHIERLLSCAPGPINGVALTHTHRDHAPGALPILAATGATLICEAAPATPENDQRIKPDQQYNEALVASGANRWLEAIPTPGHASNHLCYWLANEGMLFTGDHVMNGSTVVIAPPDGNMPDYLRSLERVCDWPLRVIAPGHGELLYEPKTEIRRLIEHRKARESKVEQALADLSPATLDQLVIRVYDDVDVRLHPIAKRSLLAHLLGLKSQGLAAENSGNWRHLS